VALRPPAPQADDRTFSDTRWREAWNFFACGNAFRYFSQRSSAEHKNVFCSGFSNVARKRSHRDCGFGDSPWLYQEQGSYRWPSLTVGARIVAPGLAQEIFQLAYVF
jgi:hypothetical protein